ncbi:MAG: LPS export ABC transporter periplasmic protein LptC [Parvularculaceae bacterium]|nr:LPS export ABC transporter periplasmic protein LptC [Parvularculaceae bacterium]
MMDAVEDAVSESALAPKGREGARPAGRTNRGSLDSLTIRRRTTGEDAVSRARFMRRMRVALPILALVLVATFLLNTRRGGVDDAFLDDFANLDATPENLKTAKPHFTGVDARGNPYEITADAAMQQADGGKIVDLEAPRAVTSAANKRSVVAAKAGAFDADTKRLELRDGVTFEHKVGGANYVLKTPAATYAIDDRTVVSDKGVDGEGSDGERLKADRMTADDKNGTLVFEGNVSMRIYPRRAEEPGAPDSGAEQPN